MKLFKKAKKDKIFFIIISIIGAYFLIAPIIPNILFYTKRLFDVQHFFTNTSLVFKIGEINENAVRTQNNDVLGINSNLKNSKTNIKIPRGKKLKIDSIDLDTKIYQGDTAYTLSKGAWIKPNSKLPGEGGKVIITAHRFQYFGKDKTFYHLDKVKKGDKIIIVWNGNIHEYKVKKIQIVNERAIWIEKQEGKEELLLYTCQGIDATTRIAINAEYKSSQILTQKTDGV